MILSTEERYISVTIFPLVTSLALSHASSRGPPAVQPLPRRSSGLLLDGFSRRTATHRRAVLLSHALTRAKR